MNGAQLDRSVPARRRPAAGARGDRHGAVGPRGRRAGKPVAELLTDDPARRWRSTRRSARSTAPGCRRAGGAAPRQRGSSASSSRSAWATTRAGGGGARGGGPEVALRLDANGAWSVEEAVRAIEALAPAGLELVEEPTHGLHAVREVRERVSTRIAIDETAAEHGALGAGVADAVCLKICAAAGSPACWRRRRWCGPRARRPTSPPRSTARSGWRRPCTPPRRWPRAGRCRRCGLATLGLFEGIEDPLPAGEGRSRCRGAGARRRPA